MLRELSCAGLQVYTDDKDIVGMARDQGERDGDAVKYKDMWNYAVWIMITSKEQQTTAIDVETTESLVCVVFEFYTYADDDDDDDEDGSAMIECEKYVYGSTLVCGFYCGSKNVKPTQI